MPQRTQPPNTGDILNALIECGLPDDCIEKARVVVNYAIDASWKAGVEYGNAILLEAADPNDENITRLQQLVIEHPTDDDSV